MSSIDTGCGVVVVRGEDIETLANESVRLDLLADASTTRYAVSTLRVELRAGADGAAPHLHHRSSELFYVLDGTAQLLAGDDVVIVGGGELVVVPAGVAHAFAAVPGADARLLVVITPGVERFEYFRQLGRIAAGHEPAQSLLAVQERYDTHFSTSPIWQRLRAASGAATNQTSTDQSDRGGDQP